MWKLSRVYKLVCVASLSLSIATLIGIQCPFSPLFDYFYTEAELLSKANTLNTIRYKKAVDYFNSSHVLSTSQLKELTEHTLDIVIVIVTVARIEPMSDDPRGYLIQTAATIGASLKRYKTGLRNLLVICNADENPELHKDAVLLQRFSAFINTKASNVIDGGFNFKASMKNNKLADSKRRREIEDYVFCMNATRSLNTKYLLMLEDDVLPVKDLFTVIEHTLAQRLYQRGRTIMDKFAFIKLYYPQRWQGFAFEEVRLAELLSIGVVGGFIMSAIFSLVYESGSDLRSITIRQCLFWTLLSVSVAKLIGRVGVMELRRLSPWLYKFGHSPACCTQAMLYQTWVLPRLMEHLLNASMNKDLAIHEFTANSGIPDYQLEPNLFLHTGMHTSLSVDSKHKSPNEFLFDMPFDLHTSY